jgi:hypothetical protein
MHIALLDESQKPNLPGYDDSLFRYFLDAHTFNSQERVKVQEKAIEGSQLTS